MARPPFSRLVIIPACFLRPSAVFFLQWYQKRQQNAVLLTHAPPVQTSELPSWSVAYGSLSLSSHCSSGSCGFLNSSILTTTNSSAPTTPLGITRDFLYVLCGLFSGSADPQQLQHLLLNTMHSILSTLRHSGQLNAQRPTLTESRNMGCSFQDPGSHLPVFIEAMEDSRASSEFSKKNIWNRWWMSMKLSQNLVVVDSRN